MKLATIPFVFRLILGGIFLYAGIIKVLDPAGFALSIYNYRLLPAELINATAILLPWVEMTAGAALLLGIAVEGGSAIVAVLLLTFSSALAIDLLRGLDIACGCFSTAEGASIDWSYLIRDLGLMFMALIILFFDRGLYSMRLLFKKSSAERSDEL
ncbi:MAG: DoxX family membrane protein [Smithellaceae bacterium]|nr:DoxX family membrane protein [Smithellaceae bacterium]